MEKHTEARIAFYAAECMEFINYGRFYENLSLEQAVKAYQKICRSNTASGPGIGFFLYDDRIPDYSDTPWPLFHGNKVAQDDIDLIAAYREHPLVKQAVKEMENYLSELTHKEKQRNSQER